MGMNAASFMSNLFLFMYELEFMQQFLERHVTGPAEVDDNADYERDYIWDNIFVKYFKYIKRYQDDRWCGNSKLLERSLYDNLWWSPASEEMKIDQTESHRYHGIYPNCLNITVEQSNLETVTHQDLRVIKFVIDPEGTEGGNPTYKYITALYDKKTDPQYDRIRPYIVHFCDPHTMLADTAIYGVVYSQTRRFAARCSLLEDFRQAVTGMISKMTDMGYMKSKIDGQFSKFANKYRCKYGRMGVKSVEQSVKNTLATKQTVADS